MNSNRFYRYSTSAFGRLLPVTSAEIGQLQTLDVSEKLRAIHLAQGVATGTPSQKTLK
ncbi:hypothetical protein [Pseudomonas rhodesiae]|uniref:hypothetical protein n=1 Tax=Pseudomonas rhodesiae TaxID=76760 RepID=UPI0012E9CCC5|nr:hypothetical protein [Pseudomonas rhodesiae]